MATAPEEDSVPEKEELNRLQTKEGLDWLSTKDGQKWLYTNEGHQWLKTESGLDWLLTEDGHKWYWSLVGRKWYWSAAKSEKVTSHKAVQWILSVNGQKWLISEEGKQWLNDLPGCSWLSEALSVDRRPSDSAENLLSEALSGDRRPSDPEESLSVPVKERESKRSQSAFGFYRKHFESEEDLNLSQPGEDLLNILCAVMKLVNIEKSFRESKQKMTKEDIRQQFEKYKVGGSKYFELAQKYEDAYGPNDNFRRQSEVVRHYLKELQKELEEEESGEAPPVEKEESGEAPLVEKEESGETPLGHQVEPGTMYLTERKKTVIDEGIFRKMVKAALKNAIALHGKERGVFLGTNFCTLLFNTVQVVASVKNLQITEGRPNISTPWRILIDIISPDCISITCTDPQELQQTKYCICPKNKNKHSDCKYVEDFFKNTSLEQLKSKLQSTSSFTVTFSFSQTCNYTVRIYKEV